ncbi:homoserine dehydrogenase [Paenibacillus koleovorans]|uniref:homoserine dehydrogenase n=1 Tax=Paenibacillus koleovorans TaxID=121608 RepID=UPI000FD74E64|nr:homoserine dehydrogenase [Paenibacillus koleovorans]
MQKDVLLTGYGNVGHAFVRLLHERSSLIEQRYGLRFRLIGVMASRGWLYDAGGLNMEWLVKAGVGSDALQRYAAEKGGWLGERSLQEIGQQAHALVESAPTDIARGEPGLTYIRQALRCGLDVVAVSKGALVTQYRELMQLAAEHNARIKYSGATAAALPTLDIGEYSLAGCTIERIEGVLNGTTNYILTRMAEGRIPFADALREAQARGIAETNPRQDISGTDSACKLVLLANGLLGASASLSDVSITGIDTVTVEQHEAARSRGAKLKLLASAVRGDDSSLTLEVAPRELEPGHPLYAVDGTEKGVVFHTDLMGRVSAIGGASSPSGAAAAALKDLINLYRDK